MHISNSKSQYSNNKANFSALRIETGSSKEGQKAKEACDYISQNIDLRGHTVYTNKCDAMFFKNIKDEDKAVEILEKKKIPYQRNSIVDIVTEPSIKNDWGYTGNTNELFKWYFENRK